MGADNRRGRHKGTTENMTDENTPNEGKGNTPEQEGCECPKYTLNIELHDHETRREEQAKRDVMYSAIVTHLHGLPTATVESIAGQVQDLYMGEMLIASFRGKGPIAALATLLGIEMPAYVPADESDNIGGTGGYLDPDAPIPPGMSVRDVPLEDNPPH